MEGKQLGICVNDYLDEADLEPFEFRVYAKIVRRAGVEGICIESITSMAGGCKMSPRKLNDCLNALALKGMIFINRRGAGTPPEITPLDRSYWSKNSHLTKKTSAPHAEGTAPHAVLGGKLPRLQARSTTPHAEGTAPHAVLDKNLAAPHAVLDKKGKIRGTAPHAEGTAPHAEGTAPHAEGTAPHAVLDKKALYILKDTIKEIKEIKEGEISEAHPSFAEPKKAKRYVHQFDPTSVPLPDNFSRGLFVSFCEMRAKMKKPLTLKALELLIRKNASYSTNELDEMFEQAIIGSWLSLWPLSPNKKQEPKKTLPPSQAPAEHREVSDAEWFEMIAKAPLHPESQLRRFN